jgi:hypothetical protein
LFSEKWSNPQAVQKFTIADFSTSPPKYRREPRNDQKGVGRGRGLGATGEFMSGRPTPAGQQMGHGGRTLRCRVARHDSAKPSRTLRIRRCLEFFFFHSLVEFSRTLQIRRCLEFFFFSLAGRIFTNAPNPAMFGFFFSREPTMKDETTMKKELGGNEGGQLVKFMSRCPTTAEQRMAHDGRTLRCRVARHDSAKASRTLRIRRYMVGVFFFSSFFYLLVEFFAPQATARQHRHR